MAFWRVSRLNIPMLPPCPEDISEPAYANLMFFAHCHVSRFSTSSGQTPLINALASQELPWKKLFQAILEMQVALVQSVLQEVAAVRSTTHYNK
jgi:hypothetical protein